MTQPEKQIQIDHGSKNTSEEILEISLLGPFRLFKTGQGELKETRRKSQALLAWLFLESGQPHTREQLITLLWPEMDRPSGLQNLRVTLSRMRKQLVDPAALETNRISITLHQSPQHKVDVLQVQALIQDAEQHAEQESLSDPAYIEKLEEALGYFRGPFLAGLNLEIESEFDEWLFVWRERLHLQRIELLNKLAIAHMDRQSFERALAYTRRQLELDPLYDRAHKRMLQLLALQKNVPAALGQFQQFKSRLQTEMGVEPDQEMLQLVDDIRSGRIKAPDSLNQGKAEAPKKLGNLPRNLTPFFGREVEIEQLSVKLTQPEYRLISLLGQGGIGKSRLAIEVARQNLHRFADGAFFVPLAGLTRADQIQAAIGAQIGCHFQSTTETIDTQLIKFLAEKEMLVVIDNIEHLLDSVDFLLEVLQNCPYVVLLVTSRIMLDVQAEDLFQLEGLAYPADSLSGVEIDQFSAVRLFCDRAHRLLKSFKLTHENTADIVAICRITEGMPLALELAASWIRDFPLSDLVDSIKDSYMVLQTSARDIPPQHRSMQAVFEYSWSLLSAGEQDLLAALSLFRGSFTAGAISKVIGSTPINLIRLCDHSLVRRLPSSGRYELHELVRQFAASKLSLDPIEQKDIEVRHADFYLSALQREANALIHTDPHAAFARLQQDFANIQMAWDRGLSHQMLTHLQNGMQALTHYHLHSGNPRSMIDLLRRNRAMNLSQTKGSNDELLISNLLTYESYLLGRLKYKDSMDVTRESFELARRIEDPYLLTLNYYIWGWRSNVQDD
ncbi:MAG: BTAD domain-containing putative transcriptional regulator, partial [Chloroflexota bacterium]